MSNILSLNTRSWCDLQRGYLIKSCASSKGIDYVLRGRNVSLPMLVEVLCVFRGRGFGPDLVPLTVETKPMLLAAMILSQGRTKQQIWL